MDACEYVAISPPRDLAPNTPSLGEQHETISDGGLVRTDGPRGSGKEAQEQPIPKIHTFWS